MPYRILKYELNIIDSVLVDIKYINKEYEYPQIIPIVLYTGNKKWNAKLDLRNTQYKWEKYKGQELSRYNILDINEISDKELLEEDSIISKIMLIEKSTTEKEIYENLNKIYRKIKNEKYTKEEIEFLIKITEVLTQNKVGQEKAKEILNKIQIGGDDNMLAVFDVIQRTNQEMISKGRKEGRKEKQIEDIKNMLKEKLPIELISRITGMSEDEINKYKR
jgi:predicted transposase/invertase (TIGR01784 family)